MIVNVVNEVLQPFYVKLSKDLKINAKEAELILSIEVFLLFFKRVEMNNKLLA